MCQVLQLTAEVPATLVDFEGLAEQFESPPVQAQVLVNSASPGQRLHHVFSRDETVLDLEREVEGVPVCAQSCVQISTVARADGQGIQLLVTALRIGSALRMLPGLPVVFVMALGIPE